MMFDRNIILISFPGGRVIIEENRIPLFLITLQGALNRLDLSGVTPPQVREGTIGAQARTLGTAAIALSQRYLIDQNAALRDG